MLTDGCGPYRPRESTRKFGKALLRLISLSPAFFFFVSCFSILLLSANSYPAEITIAWSPATDAKVAGYRVYYWQQGQRRKIQADAGAEYQITLRNLQEGAAYSFLVVTYDSTGRESTHSQRTTITSLKDKDTHSVPILPPRAPSPPDEETFPDIPPECEYVLSLPSQSFLSSGGAGTVRVSTKLHCPWTAVANAPWVTITSNSTWSGSGVIYYVVKPNSSASPRKGTLTVAGQTVQLNQMGHVRHFLRINTRGTGTGSVASVPAGADFDAGTVVTLSAAPSANSTFAGWSGRCSGAKPTCRVTMNSSITVNAAFRLKTFIISAKAGANGSISPSGSIAINYGGSQKFIFRPNKGYRIGNIKVDGISVGNPQSFLFDKVMNSHRIEAVFSPIRGMEKE